MDIFISLIGFLFILLGIVGAFLPILPGPITGWVGLLILHFTDAVPMDKTFLVITLIVSIVVLVIDYIIPAIGTKKFGGSKYGVIGTMLGLLLGILFFPPIGFIVGPFIGAFLGEMIHDSSDSGRALKAALGSFIGFVSSTFLKFATAVVFMAYFIAIFWEYRSAMVGF